MEWFQKNRIIKPANGRMHGYFKFLREKPGPPTESLLLVPADEIALRIWEEAVVSICTR